MKLVTATFSDEIDYGTLRLAVLSAEAVTINAELLNGVNRRKD